MHHTTRHSQQAALARRLADLAARLEDAGPTTLDAIAADLTDCSVELEQLTEEVFRGHR